MRAAVPRGRAQALPNTVALIVNHENITQNWYVGNDRSMLVCNCLFRIGGAAAVMSNRRAPAGAGAARTVPAGEPACTPRLWADVLHAPSALVWARLRHCLKHARRSDQVRLCSMLTGCAVCDLEAALPHIVSRWAAGPPGVHEALVADEDWAMSALPHACAGCSAAMK